MIGAAVADERLQEYCPRAHLSERGRRSAEDEIDKLTLEGLEVIKFREVGVDITHQLSVNLWLGKVSCGETQ